MNPDPPRVAETHISYVLLTEDRAYKLLKHIRTHFLDFSDRQGRLDAARRELELNRRLAPDVYLGLADIEELGELTDRLIVMRRMPDERRLSAMVGTESFDDALRSVAHTIAAFHSRLPPITDGTGMARRDDVARNWEDNLADMAPLVGSVLDPEEYDLVAARARRYLENHEAVFEQRLRDGWVRDGHGDLLAEDIFYLDDGPRILDCLAFSDDYRITDVLADVAFLAMDLHRLAGPEAARKLMGWYHEFSNEHHPASLGHHYVAYRAHVRAKVACLRVDQGDQTAAETARLLHGLTAHHLARGEVRLVVIGGGPGVGKSTIAQGLSDRLGWAGVATDETRKDLAGLGHGVSAAAAPDAGLYATEMTDRTYAEVLREARLLLLAGESTIIDASWTSNRHRDDARRLARELGVPLQEIRCVAPPDVARRRIERRRRRGGDPSDATTAIVDHLAARADPWPEALVLDTQCTAEAAVDQLLGALVPGWVRT